MQDRAPAKIELKKKSSPSQKSETGGQNKPGVRDHDARLKKINAVGTAARSSTSRVKKNIQTKTGVPNRELNT
jgi:hypothetical protein